MGVSLPCQGAGAKFTFFRIWGAEQVYTVYPVSGGHACQTVYTVYTLCGPHCAAHTVRLNTARPNLDKGGRIGNMGGSLAVHVGTLKKTIWILQTVAILLLAPLAASAQDILTAEAYFDEISARYGKIQDYSATVTITQGETVMKGKLYYKTPNLLRIDFSDPADQVLVTDGEELTIYIPRYEVVLLQKLKRRSQAALATLVSEQGLNLLKKNYAVAYLSGPGFVPLEDGNPEVVRKLKLTSRSTAEGFRQITLAVGRNGLIRRITGVTLNYQEFVLDLTDILTNQNIPDTRFQYDSPPYANVYQDFLFDSDQ
jgi:outer membrane lipoprotein-sorting protein